MITGTFIARRVNDDPPGYRVWFDDGTGELAIGSISERTSHITHVRAWHWGIDTFPFPPAGPSGDVLTFGEAQGAFRREFLRWINELPPRTWQRNRDYMRTQRDHK